MGLLNVWVIMGWCFVYPFWKKGVVPPESGSVPRDDGWNGPFQKGKSPNFKKRALHLTEQLGLGGVLVDCAEKVASDLCL